MAYDTTGIYTWSIRLDESDVSTPWKATGVRRQSGIITVTYEFAQATLAALMIAIDVAMGGTP